MKRVLMVDDDQFVLRLYQEALRREGFEVTTAQDGLAAMKALRANKPDVVVLDLMMPTFSGVDVLKFIRSQPDLAALPVIVLSNSYMDDLAQGAATGGVQKALLKVSCSPSVLLGVITELRDGEGAGLDTSRLLAVPKVTSAPLPKSTPTVVEDPGSPNRPVAPEPLVTLPRADQELRTKARGELLENASATLATLHQLGEALNKATREPEQQMRLQDLYRKVHFVTAAAGLAECPELAQMSSVFEALLFALTGKPRFFTMSVRQTISQVVEFFGFLLERARQGQEAELLPACVLVVDDEPVSSRLAVSALQAARLEAHSIQDPLKALEAMRQALYDLLLLDIEMPGMDGFELCRKLRALPGYDKVPVIYVTLHADFKSRSKSIRSGGNDLIAKPVFPMELATKAVMHLLRAR